MISMTLGMIIPIPMRARRTMPAQRMTSCGRCRRLRSVDPSSVKAVKLMTSPATTR